MTPSRHLKKIISCLKNVAMKWTG